MENFFKKFFHLKNLFKFKQNNKDCKNFSKSFNPLTGFTPYHPALLLSRLSVAKTQHQPNTTFLPPLSKEYFEQGVILFNCRKSGAGFAFPCKLSSFQNQIFVVKFIFILRTNKLIWCIKIRHQLLFRNISCCLSKNSSQSPLI